MILTAGYPDLNLSSEEVEALISDTCRGQQFIYVHP
jgi:hypothetical protein